MQRIGEVVRGHRKALEISQAALAWRIGELRGKPLEAAYISHMEIGRGYAARPTPEMMELVARALEIKPTAFVEYRLALVRRAFSEYDAEARFVPGVGFDQAARNLAELEAGRCPAKLASALGAGGPGGGGDPREAAQVAAPPRRGSPPKPRRPGRKPRPRSKKAAG